MKSLERETVEGLNKQIGTIKGHADQTGDTRVSFVRFNSGINAVYEMRPAVELREIAYDEYRPGEMTRLYDAVGYTLRQALNEEDRLRNLGEDLSDTAHLVLVVSDGQENSSRDFDGPRIASMVKEAQDTGRFTFAYLGANQDLADVKKHLNEAWQTTAWKTTRAGTQTAYATSSGATLNYAQMRSSGGTASSNFWGTDKSPDEIDETNVWKIEDVGRFVGKRQG